MAARLPDPPPPSPDPPTNEISLLNFSSARPTTRLRRPTVRPPPSSARGIRRPNTNVHKMTVVGGYAADFRHIFVNFFTAEARLCGTAAGGIAGAAAAHAMLQDLVCVRLLGAACFAFDAAEVAAEECNPRPSRDLPPQGEGGDRVRRPPSPSPSAPLPPPHGNTFPRRPLPPTGQDRTGRTWRAQRKLGRGKGNTKGGNRADCARRKWCRAQQEAKERTKGKESLWLLEAPVRKIILQMHTPARTSWCWGRQTQHGLGVCIWMHLVNGTGSSLSPGRPTPGVVKQDKSSGGSVDTTKTRSNPQRVGMCSGERPIGAAKGNQTNAMASCQTPHSGQGRKQTGGWAGTHHTHCRELGPPPPTYVHTCTALLHATPPLPQRTPNEKVLWNGYGHGSG